MSWSGLVWPESDVVVLASGESLTGAQCDLVRAWRAAAPKRYAIAINTTYRRAPWADVLYGCDQPWWNHYFSRVATGEWPMFHGERWTQDLLAHRTHGIKWVESLPLPGLGRRPGIIHQGQNGGYQAVNLAFQAGARRIILLGFDMHGGHWHGDHPAPLTNPRPYLFDAYKKHFARLAQDLRGTGCQAVNCSPGSALTCFPLGKLETVLEMEPA